MLETQCSIMMDIKMIYWIEIQGKIKYLCIFYNILLLCNSFKSKKKGKIISII